MGSVLTTGSTISCKHGGTATLSSSAKLRVGGNPVLLKADATTWAFTKCGQVGTGLTPCTNIVSLSAGEAGKLTVGGVPVLLDSLAGQTNGKPENTLSATAGQNKLTAT
jgi:hypothetical protein